MAAAVVGVFASHEHAERGPTGRAVVAATAVAPGQELTDADVQVVAVDLPDASADRSFPAIADVVGSVALAPLGPGEIVQRSAVLPADPPASDPPASPASSGATGRTGPTREISISIPGDRAVDGDLRPGEQVDVLATFGTGADAYTAVVSRGATVRRAQAGGAAALGSTGAVTVTLGLHSADEVLRLAHARELGALALVRTTRAGGADPGPEAYRAVPPR